MIDYFALLDQPRAAWLDLEELKEIYHQKTLRAHPDAQASRGENGGADFVDLNEAYRALQDPKHRLHHLLSLEGCAPSPSQTVPVQLHDLFPEISALTQRAKLLLENIRGTSSALSRSLLKSKIVDLQTDAKETRGKIQGLYDTSLGELRRINADWATNPKEQIESLSNLYFVFAYLERWSAQLDEMMFQLSLH